MRATPTQLRMASSGHKIRLLRFEPANQSDNRQLCQNLTPGISPSQIAYRPNQLCQGSACPGKNPRLNLAQNYGSYPQRHNWSPKSI